MKKVISFILILSTIFTLGKFISNNNIQDNTKISNILNKKNSSQTSEDKDKTYSMDDSNKILSRINNNEDLETVTVNVGNNEYIVAVDDSSKEILINENLNSSDKYIKVNYEEIIPIIKEIEDPTNLSIPEYINIYNKVSPYINTNMSYTELLSLASNIDDLKSIYEHTKND